MARLRLLALFRRFRSVAADDGFGSAVRRAGGSLRRRWTGEGASTLQYEADPTPRPEQYLHGIWRNLAQEGAFHVDCAPAVHRRRRQIAMIADLNLPQCRKYRVEQMAAFWRERGVEFEYAHHQDVPRASRILQSATHLMEYRLQTNPVTEMFRYEARRLRLPILYDLDDPLFSVSAYETYRNMDALPPGLKAHFMSEAPRYLAMMNGADILSVSTPGMAAHVASYSPRPVFVRRNFADAETLEAGQRAIEAEHPADGLFRVAFASGSQGHEIDLAEMLDPLAAFIAAAPNRRLMILGHFDLSHLPEELAHRTEVTPFSDYAAYLSTLRRANCAVMPLCDDIFNRCKSAVRVIDASAVAVPAIVGPVGDLPNVVRHGDTGLVVSDCLDWAAALDSLADDPAAAAAMGQRARADLEARWCGQAKDHIVAPELMDWVAA